jgi:hypothetical protein
MKQSDIKRVIGKLEPDAEMARRLSSRMHQKPHARTAYKSLAILAASVAVVICVGILSGNPLGLKPGRTPGQISQNSGIAIPKVQLPDHSGSQAKMMPLIVYQGRIYLQSTASMAPETAEKLLGEKLGTTKGSLTEWSKQDEYAVEFASTVGVTDVYTVNGYDKSFRIMTCEKLDGKNYPQIFECLNGLTVKTGEDLFGKLKMEGNMESIQYESFDSWNNGKQLNKPLADLSLMENFLKALNTSEPINGDSLSNLFEEQSADSQKFVNIRLRDGTEVQLRLFKDGYAYYNNINIFFKIDSTEFISFWDKLI